MAVQYGPADLEAQLRVKDVFDPHWLLNPAKVFPLATSASRRRGVIAAPASVVRGSVGRVSTKPAAPARQSAWIASAAPGGRRRG